MFRQPARNDRKPDFGLLKFVPEDFDFFPQPRDLHRLRAQEIRKRVVHVLTQLQLLKTKLVLFRLSPKLLLLLLLLLLQAVLHVFEGLLRLGEAVDIGYHFSEVVLAVLVLPVDVGQARDGQHQQTRQHKVLHRGVIFGCLHFRETASPP